MTLDFHQDSVWGYPTKTAQEQTERLKAMTLPSLCSMVVLCVISIIRKTKTTTTQTRAEKKLLLCVLKYINKTHWCLKWVTLFHVVFALSQRSCLIGPRHAVSWRPPPNKRLPWIMCLQLSRINLWLTKYEWTGLEMMDCDWWKQPQVNPLKETTGQFVWMSSARCSQESRLKSWLFLGLFVFKSDLNTKDYLYFFPFQRAGSITYHKLIIWWFWLKIGGCHN